MTYGWGSWRASIKRPLDRLGGSIFLYRPHLESKRYQVFHFNDKGEGVATDTAPNTEVPPTMTFSDEMDLRGIIGAFRELAKELGEPTSTEEHMAGQLEAVQDHLNDMRRLIFSNTELTSRVPLFSNGQEK